MVKCLIDDFIASGIAIDNGVCLAEDAVGWGNKVSSRAELLVVRKRAEDFQLFEARHARTSAAGA